MPSQQVLTLDRDEKKIVLALLLHPRLFAIRRQFQECVFDVLDDGEEIERISQITELPRNELVHSARHALVEFEHDRDCEEDSFGQMADIAVAFFASPRCVTVWGHFTMALQKIAVDEVTIGEVAARCGASQNDQVRRAIRHFSSLPENQRC